MKGGVPANLDVYDAQGVADHYATLDYLTPCERLLFDTYIQSGSAILDLGVGGGRTTGYLSGRASRYVGVDYASPMVEACRRRFPGLEFVTGDAANLTVFADGSFDAVFFSFNGIDYVLPNDRRHSAWKHIHRVLRPGGSLVFSSHNPRAVVVFRSWNRDRIGQIAGRWSMGSRILRGLLWMILASVRATLAFFQTIGATVLRMLQRLPSRVFWRGEGTRMDSAHGGLLTHYWTPPHALRELATFGFRLVRILGDDYPRSSHLYSTDWYYYVFIKSCEK
ncbi:MAG: class I SAM-dependent methyltransferase [Candidatus Sulfotelmatobacter sp.]